MSENRGLNIVLGAKLDVIKSKISTKMDDFIQGLDKNMIISFKINIPLQSYVRGAFFCDDVSELSGYEYMQQDLMEMLFYDFLTDYRMNPDHAILFSRLLTLDRRINELDRETKLLKLHLPKKDIVRGQLAFYELEETYPDHGYTLEKMLMLLYCDFIKHVESGARSDIVKKIVKGMDA